jgi:hypothetical protein
VIRKSTVSDSCASVCAKRGDLGIVLC